MQIKEFEAYNLKDCLQKVRDDLGSEAVILETRKARKGGIMGWGARETIRIVAAVGIAVKQDVAAPRRTPTEAAVADASSAKGSVRPPEKELSPPSDSSEYLSAASRHSVPAARHLYTRATQTSPRERTLRDTASLESPSGEARLETPIASASTSQQARKQSVLPGPGSEEQSGSIERFATLERAMRDIRDGLDTLHKEQQETAARTASAVVSAVSAALPGPALEEGDLSRFQALRTRLINTGISDSVAEELLDELPDFSAWAEEARPPLAIAALRDLIRRRVASSGPIALTPGQLKAVALIGPTGVGKTTTIAKLAAHFALVERKRVALLTVDTYRIAAVEQLKTYSQIIDIPISVAYSHAEVLPAIERFSGYDLLLIDTAGRSQKNIMQVGELKTLLETVRCETHLVLAAQMKEQDMIEATQRFAAARVDRLLLSKLDETSVYGTLLNVALRTGIPLSYMTTGQKVPEDIELADGSKLASLILD